MSNPSDELKAAARKIRELAGVATPGPWLADPTGTVCAAMDLIDDVLPAEGPREVAECYRSEHRGERAANATHVALWHPGNAHLVADLLDANAGWWRQKEDQTERQEAPADSAALRLARSINGGAA